MLNKLSAEFFGTFWLVFGGCGSAILAAAFPELGIGFLGVALAFGLTVLTMAYAVGGISGGHFNPAVSLGLTVAGRLPAKDLIPIGSRRFWEPSPLLPSSMSLLLAKMASRLEVSPRTVMVSFLPAATA